MAILMAIMDMCVNFNLTLVCFYVNCFGSTELTGTDTYVTATGNSILQY